MTDFENILAAATAGLEEEIGGEDDDDADATYVFVASRALAAFRQEIERGLAGLKKTIASPPSSDDAPKSRAPKKIKPKERLGDGQQDWVIEDAQPARAESP